MFPRALDAIVAAIAIQREMAAEPWPERSPLRIRVGLHTGQARIVAGDYVGLDVHRAARIMAAAHGGEIVASAATCEDAGTDIAGGIELRDLGEHRLRDLSAPERLYQVIADGLVAEFPALRTLDRTPNNLPTQPTALIGRDVELERIRAATSTCSFGSGFSTLTGPGGIGKTRLALQAAADQSDRVRDGVYFVDLTEVHDAPGALREIANTLGAAVRAGADLRLAIASSRSASATCSSSSTTSSRSCRLRTTWPISCASAPTCASSSRAASRFVSAASSSSRSRRCNSRTDPTIARPRPISRSSRPCACSWNGPVRRAATSR